MKAAHAKRPSKLDGDYGMILRSQKAGFVSSAPDGWRVAQHGAAHIPAPDWPGWPTELGAGEPVIETFVAAQDEVVATGANSRWIDAWAPRAAWLNATVRKALAAVEVHVAGDAYVTASTTPSDELEGLAHLDDAMFIPEDSVSMVAIIGQHAGPRMAITPAKHPEIRSMTTLTFDQELLDSFANDVVEHCCAQADELVVFPQFGQIHAGPAARHVAHLAPSRQLLVMRAAVVASTNADAAQRRSSRRSH